MDLKKNYLKVYIMAARFIFFSLTPLLTLTQNLLNDRINITGLFLFNLTKISSPEISI